MGSYSSSFFEGIVIAKIAVVERIKVSTNYLLGAFFSVKRFNCKYSKINLYVY